MAECKACARNRVAFMALERKVAALTARAEAAEAKAARMRNALRPFAEFSVPKQQIAHAEKYGDCVVYGSDQDGVMTEITVAHFFAARAAMEE